MKFLDDTRLPMQQNDHWKKHYNTLEQKKWYCGLCDKEINGNSDELIYLGEYDLVFHIENLNKGELTQVFESLGNKKIKTYSILVSQPEIPQLKKLIENILIKSDNDRSAILRRDEYKCQFCGEDDINVLSVHHIIPRKSPFTMDDFKKSPLNCITLCANDHMRVHYIMREGSDDERSELKNKFVEVTGIRPTSIQYEMVYPDSDRRKWNKISKLNKLS